MAHVKLTVLTKQGLKPNAFFCRVCGPAEAVPLLQSEQFSDFLGKL